MLVLSRRKDESLFIYPSLDVDPNMTVAELFKDGPIKVMLTSIANKQASIGIDAPQSLAVARAEVVDSVCGSDLLNLITGQ